MAPEFDLLIKGGLVYNGTGSPPEPAEIGIKGDKINFIGKSGAEAATVINAKGLAVSPGFIDTHSHSDFTIVADGRAHGKILQGITTEIEGNCGMSAAPLYKKAFEKREDDLKELGIRERWNTLEEYFKLVDKRGLALNIAMLAGHGNIRGSVVGYDNKRPSAGEMSEMLSLLRTALEHGAIGFSTGLIYPPGIYSATEELVELAKTLRQRDLIYTSHMRSEGEQLEEAVAEVIRIGSEAAIKVHISHIKTAGNKNWHKADGVIRMVEGARRSGVRLTCDRYPYIASSTDLDSILPSWAFAGGNDEEIRRLTDENERGKITHELLKRAESGEYWKKIIISSAGSEKNRWMEGMTMSEIAGKLNKKEIDLMFELLIEERLRVGAIFLSMSEDNLRKFLSRPYCMIGSDSSARSFDGPTRQGKPHPRTFGTFPRLMGEYVREENLLPLEEAIRKSTMLAAGTFGLKGRGQIKKGMFADIVIFDAGKISDRAVFKDPFHKPDGISFVLVNGVPVVWEGEPTKALPGRVLRN